MKEGGGGHGDAGGDAGVEGGNIGRWTTAVSLNEALVDTYPMYPKKKKILPSVFWFGLFQQVVKHKKKVSIRQ